MRSTPAPARPLEGSTDAWHRRLRNFAHSPDARAAGPLGVGRDRLTDAGLHPARAEQDLLGFRQRRLEQPLHRAPGRHAGRDHCRLRRRLRAGLRARHRGRPLAHRGILPLPDHRHVPGDAEGGAGAAHHRLVRPGADVESGERRARRLLPADGQHHRRPALGRRGPHQPDALAVCEPLADLHDAAASQCPAVHLRRPRDRDDFRPHRRHRR